MPSASNRSCLRLALGTLRSPWRLQRVGLLADNSVLDFPELCLAPTSLELHSESSVKTQRRKNEAAAALSNKDILINRTCKNTMSTCSALPPIHRLPREEQTRINTKRNEPDAGTEVRKC